MSQLSQVCRVVLKIVKFVRRLRCVRCHGHGHGHGHCQVSRVALCMSKVKVRQWVSQSVSEWVSQWVTDMGRLWSDLGPIKIWQVTLFTILWNCKGLLRAVLTTCIWRGRFDDFVVRVLTICCGTSYNLCLTWKIWRYTIDLTTYLCCGRVYLMKVVHHTFVVEDFTFVVDGRLHTIPLS